MAEIARHKAAIVNVSVDAVVNDVSSKRAATTVPPGSAVTAAAAAAATTTTTTAVKIANAAFGAATA
ncbi:MAG: hypothetical protein RMM53_05430, partial [Bacteroidia bacterium]|nr:hypothetical protein [Bacteroidia bacterium]